MKPSIPQMSDTWWHSQDIWICCDRLDSFRRSINASANQPVLHFLADTYFVNNGTRCRPSCESTDEKHLKCSGGLKWMNWVLYLSTQFTVNSWLHKTCILRMSCVRHCVIRILLSYFNVLIVHYFMQLPCICCCVLGVYWMEHNSWNHCLQVSDVLYYYSIQW